MSAQDPLHIVGQMLAEKYRIEVLVGEGGFAVVYRANHVIWNQRVAIKFFSGLSSAPAHQREELATAFVQEGALLTELSTQTVNIVQARDVGTLTTPDGQWVPYMVLEWLDGEPLDSLLARERDQGKPPWPLADVLALLGQVASALDVAHGKGIAHRDIKPANLFMVRHDGTPRVKVLDFGVAKMMSDNTQIKAALAKTGTNITAFTPQYGAPEQFNRSFGATGPWTDVYALALVGVEMLAGREALAGNDLVQLGFCTANPTERPTPRALGVVLPDAVEAVFAKALAVNPAERYARAGEFWAALQASMEGSLTSTLNHPFSVRAQLETGATQLLEPPPGSTGTTQSTSSSVTQPGRKPRSKTPALVGVLLAVAAAATAGFFALQSSPTPSNAAPAGGPSSAPAQVSAEASATPSPAPHCPDDMATIPAGQFFMGSDSDDARDNEKPAHNVTLGAFCIDLYEVTAKKYKACSDVGKCKRARPEVDWPGISDQDKAVYAPVCTIADPMKAKHPINCVTWEMASTFCRANGRRLPTEAEWEYATRGPDGRVYPWGDETPGPEHLNACGTECVAWAKAHDLKAEFPGALYPADDGFATTAPVGQFEAGRSRFGPYDVVGNVWEWVADWDGPYTKAALDNPKGPDSGEKRVIRGGAWNGSFASWLRPSFRYAQDPGAKSPGIGFRCARSLQ